MQSKPVIREWHNPDEHIDLGNSGTMKKRNFESPKLTNYVLKKPTTINSGGQGTVAWVKDSGNNVEYALKFKVRDKRSEKNWRIERREADILKKIKHSFVVRYA